MSASAARSSGQRDSVARSSVFTHESRTNASTQGPSPDCSCASSSCARDLVTRGHVAQRVAVLGDQHEADARAGEDAGRAAHDPRDAALDVDFVAVGQVEVGEAPRQRLAVDMLRRLAHRGMVRRPRHARDVSPGRRARDHHTNALPERGAAPRRLETFNAQHLERHVAGSPRRRCRRARTGIDRPCRSRRQPRRARNSGRGRTCRWARQISRRDARAGRRRHRRARCSPGGASEPRNGRERNGVHAER